MTPKFFQGARLKKKIWVDFTGYPSNQFSGYRLNGRIIHFHYSTSSIFSSVFFNILKEPLLVQKQTIHQQKALDLSYLEPEGQGQGIIMRAWQCHRKQRVKNPPRTCKKSKMLFAARGRDALLIMPRPLSGSQIKLRSRAFC